MKKEPNRSIKRIGRHERSIRGGLGGAGIAAGVPTASGGRSPVVEVEEEEAGNEFQPSVAAASAAANVSVAVGGKGKDEEEDEEEENMDVELGKFSSAGDPDKLAKMQTILSQFTEEQMSRSESFRRSGFKRSNMKRLLASITGTQKYLSP
ncbi:hypothetical protein HPP92_006010 [Vanilla planifolia]|uniref:TAFII28-like protein domain-containing protein n=1 Tax=Vanilla planifolia TaxID=51239 RepID=A0A835RUR4_VANPL|nr:hypothetical protein HPP92_006010 [Vanilla planifolia]